MCIYRKPFDLLEFLVTKFQERDYLYLVMYITVSATVALAYNRKLWYLYVSYSLHESDFVLAFLYTYLFTEHSLYCTASLSNSSLTIRREARISESECQCVKRFGLSCMSCLGLKLISGCLSEFSLPFVSFAVFIHFY